MEEPKDYNNTGTEANKPSEDVKGSKGHTKAQPQQKSGEEEIKPGFHFTIIFHHIMIKEIGLSMMGEKIL